MNEKRYKTLVALMMALLLISVGLFVLQGYMDSRNHNDAIIPDTDSETMVIYRAVTDIPVFAALESRMFEAITIPKISDIGFVTDIREIEGMFAKSHMFRGSFLADVNLTHEDFSAGLTHTIEVRADFSGNLQYGDLVDVFAVSTRGNVVPLFNNKRLYSPIGHTGTSLGRLFVRVTHDELVSYFSMLNAYRFAVIPLDPHQVSGGSPILEDSPPPIDSPMPSPPGNPLEPGSGGEEGPDFPDTPDRP